MTSIFLLAVYLGVIFWLLLSVAVIYILLRSIVNGAIYFPTSTRNVAIIKEFAGVKAGEKAVDLGSGDGRIVIALAQEGIEAHGYEINPLLVWRSRKRIRAAGLEGKAFVHWKSLWKDNLNEFNAVTVYGIPYIMGRLETKLKRELKPGARVVSNIFRFPGWQPRASKENVHLYVREG